MREVNIAQGGQFIVTTDGADGLDIDLNIYKDGGNGAFDCGNAPGDDDTGIGGSAGATAEEQVGITLPEDGKYWVAVQGFAVPGGSQPFSLTIDVIQGSDLTVSNAPEGAVDVGDVGFNVNYTTTATAPKTLRGLLFETNSAELSAEAKSQLDTAAANFKQLPADVAAGVSIVVEGHTDSTGSDAYNQGLSQRRADAGRQYLIDAGLPASIITAKGMARAARWTATTPRKGADNNRRIVIRATR
ncbi:MAG: OmpA family protein [Rhodospirillales bacterium]|nr:OmpA family protein [Rhodospirillales bacterium]